MAGAVAKKYIHDAANSSVAKCRDDVNIGGGAGSSKARTKIYEPNVKKIPDMIKRIQHPASSKAFNPVRLIGINSVGIQIIHGMRYGHIPVSGGTTKSSWNKSISMGIAMSTCRTTVCGERLVNNGLSKTVYDQSAPVVQIQLQTTSCPRPNRSKIPAEDI